MKIDATSDLTKADVRQAIRTAHDIKQGLFMRYLDDEMFHYLNNTVKKNLRKITEDDDPGYLSYSDHSMVYIPNGRPLKKAKDMLLIASDVAYRPYIGDLRAAFEVFGYDINQGSIWPGLSVDRVFNDLKSDMDNAKVIGVITGSNTEFLDKVLRDYAEKVIVLPSVAEFDDIDDFVITSMFNDVSIQWAPFDKAFEAARMMFENYEEVTNDDYKPYLTQTDVDTPMTSTEFYDYERTITKSVVMMSLYNYYFGKRCRKVLDKERLEREERWAKHNNE